MTVAGPTQCPTPPWTEASKPTTNSICLLLDRCNSTTPSTQIKSPTTPTPTPTAKLLQARSLSILASFNARDAAAPYTLHSTPDFHFLHEAPDGSMTSLNRGRAMNLMRHVILKNIEHYAEVMSSAVEVDEERGEGVVWVGMRIHDRPDGFMPGTEKVTMFFWRRVEGIGGECRWMWWKHVCLSARMPFPR